MNLKQTLVALTLIGTAAGAMAVEATQWNPPASRGLSRADVKAELASAAASGELDRRGEAYAGFSADRPRSTLARADVKTELARARADGELDGRNEAYAGVVQAHPHAPVQFFAFRKSHGDAKSKANGG